MSESDDRGRYVVDGPKGEWFPFTFAHGVRQQCCHCGYVHDLEFKRVGRIMFMRFVANMRATAAARRTRKKQVIIVE